MSADAIKLDDEVIVAIPDESVVKVRDGELAAPSQEKKDPPARVSALARGGRGRDDASEKDERIAALEREREEARREAEAARAALAEASEFARQAQAGRATAEDTARLREQQAMRAHVLRLQSDKSQIEGAISATQSEAAMAQRELIQAIEAGDAKRQAEAQHAIAKAEAALSQLENGKYAADTELSKANRLFEEHEQARATRKTEPTPERRTEPQSEAMTPDKWIDTTVRQVLGDKGADWLRENKQFATDTKLNRKFLRFADEYAEDHGQGALKSAEFLEALNDKFFPDREEPEPEPERVVERQRPASRATSAAPVSRTNNQFFSSRNLNAAQVKLPPKLASFVKQSGLNPTEYALQCVADIKAGKLPKDYLDPDYDHGI